MRVTYVAAGAAGMICGSCLRDNALARELRALGCEVTFVPVYTPIKTEEHDESENALLFGGISVFLEQKSVLFRRLPRFVLRWLDRPSFVKRMTAKRSLQVEAQTLGELTLSMLRGEQGHQRKEVGLAIDWIRSEGRPDLVNLTNLLIAGFVPALRRSVDAPVLVTLQGDDLFLDELTEQHRGQVLAELRRLADQIDGFVTFSGAYANMMAELLEVPREKFHLVPIGIDPSEFMKIERQSDRPPSIGYFGRIAPEKGFDVSIDAFIELHRSAEHPEARLKAGGWLGDADKEFFEAQIEKLKAAGLESMFEHFGSPDRAGKLAFYSSIDVFSMPAAANEPKGLCILEAMASGLPVVQPAHAIFPDLVTGGEDGLLVPPDDPAALAKAWSRLLGNPEERERLGTSARATVAAKFTDIRMAEETLKLYERFVAGTV